MIGCTKLSEECEHCYAADMVRRFGKLWGVKEGFGVTLRLQALPEPLKLAMPRTIFVCPLADLFHEQVPDGHIVQVFRVMRGCPRHNFIVLTKRAERMANFLLTPALTAATESSVSGAWPPTNVWLGVTAGTMRNANERVPHLLRIGWGRNFLSAEPLLEEMRLPQAWFWSIQQKRGLRWVITGPESGRQARPTPAGAFALLRHQCAYHGIPFWFKGHGGVLEGKVHLGRPAELSYDGR